jgi:hypothetical protein
MNQRMNGIARAEMFDGQSMIKMNSVRGEVRACRALDKRESLNADFVTLEAVPNLSNFWNRNC